MGDVYSRPARPWDLFNKNIKKVSPEAVTDRMAICNACPELIKATSQCKKCGCLMNLKTKLPNAFCPLGKWGIIKVEFQKEE